jgi:hypothetical protein
MDACARKDDARKVVRNLIGKSPDILISLVLSSLCSVSSLNKILCEMWPLLRIDCAQEGGNDGYESRKNLFKSGL